jgi:transposase InsO family protein
MPWKEKGLKTMREEFVKRVLSQEKSKSALCKEYGISRPTGDKWIARYLAGEDLNDKSKAPKTAANKTATNIEAFIVSYRRKYPAIGAQKIHQMLLDEGIKDIPCPKTINNIFKRNGLITKEASEAVTPYKRFEKSVPNEMWQADFKGHFVIKDGFRCHPLDIIDDYSRYSLCCAPLGGETFAEVRPYMENVFKEYGLPFSFLCDNGNPWGTSQSTGFTKFEVWLMELGVLVLHGRGCHPQTQGKEERFNGSLTREFLKYSSFENQVDAAQKLSEYRNFYNNKRPHHALNLKTPSSLYSKSPIHFPDKIEAWEYSDDFKTRNVKDSGYVSILNQGYFLSEAFGGKQIAIRESSKGGSLVNLYFRQFKIAQIDVDKRVFTFRRAYLIDGDPRFMHS